MPFSFLSPCPLPPALPCLLASISPPPSGSGDERAAAMIAWRVLLPACLPVVDLPVSASHRCRLVGRSGERAVFALGSVMAICPRARPVASSRWYGSCPWRLASMNCPLVPLVCFLSLLVSSVVSFPHLGGHLVVPVLPPMCFSCVFSVHSPASCPRLICPRARLVQSSRHLVSSCVS